MSVFFIFQGKITSPEKFGEYAKFVAPTLEPFEGSVTLKGKAVQVVAGTNDKETVGILAFPNVEKALGWYNSVDYQSLIPLRDEAAEVSAICYQVPPA